MTLGLSFFVRLSTMVELSVVKHCGGVDLEKEMKASRKIAKYDSTYLIILAIDMNNS